MSEKQQSFVILENLYSTGCRDKFILRNSLQLKMNLSKQEAVRLIKDWVETTKPSGIYI